MTEVDHYIFKNPARGEWNLSELSVVEKDGDNYCTTLSSNQWDITIHIEAKRKPKPIEAGYEWVSKLTNAYINSGDIVKVHVTYEVEDEWFVVFSVSGDTHHVLNQPDFRKCFIYGDKA